MSNEHKKYLKRIRINNIAILFIQLLIIISFLFIWDILIKYNIISSFIYSSPHRIVITLKYLWNNNLLIHIFITLKEIFISFILGIILGFIIALILYESRILAKIIDPFLTMINSLPKVALGPLIIIIFGSNIKSVIIMAILINLIVSIMSIYNGFLNIDEYKIKLFDTFKATRLQKLKYLVIPNSYQTIISSLKLCISQTLIGVIMGELLVSKEGIGYIIVYGKQVFNLDYVMSGIILLAIISYVLYKLVVTIENRLLKYI